MRGKVLKGGAGCIDEAWSGGGTSRAHAFLRNVECRDTKRKKRGRRDDLVSTFFRRGHLKAVPVGHLKASRDKSQTANRGKPWRVPARVRACAQQQSRCRRASNACTWQERMEQGATCEARDLPASCFFQAFPKGGFLHGRTRVNSLVEWTMRSWLCDTDGLPLATDQG